MFYTFDGLFDKTIKLVSLFAVCIPFCEDDAATADTVDDDDNDVGFELLDIFSSE